MTRTRWADRQRALFLVAIAITAAASSTAARASEPDPVYPSSGSAVTATRWIAESTRCQAAAGQGVRTNAVAALDTALDRVGVPDAHVTDHFSSTICGVALDATSSAQAQALDAQPGIEVFPDRQVHASSDQLAAIGLPLPAGRTDTDGSALDGRGQTIAIVDTGIDYTQPALGGCTTLQVTTTHDCKVEGGWDFVNNDADPMDDMGHGTHVAGIAAGDPNVDGGALAGVAPGARLLAYKVLGSGGSGYTSDVILGIDRAVQDGATVINLSLGSASVDPNDPTEQAVAAAVAQNVVVVVAAGNNYGGGMNSPARSPAAIAVGALDVQADGTLSASPFTSLGDTSRVPDVAAPGSEILSTATSYAGAMLGAGSLECTDGRQVGDPSDSCRLSGTSMATPHVAGAAAILRQQHPELGAAAIGALLVSTATPSGAPGVAEGPAAEGAGIVSLAAATAPLAVLPGASQTTLANARASVSDIDDTVTLSNPTASVLDVRLSTHCAPYWPRGGTRGLDPTTMQAPCSFVSLPATVSIAAHGSASVPVHELGDPALGTPGSWYGSVDATVGSTTTHVPFIVTLGPVGVFHVRDATGVELSASCADIGCTSVDPFRRTRAWLTDSDHQVFGVTLGAQTLIPSGDVRFAFLDSTPVHGSGDAVVVAQSLPPMPGGRGTTDYWFGGSDLKRTLVRNTASDGTPGTIESITIALDREGGLNPSLAFRDAVVDAHPQSPGGETAFWTEANTPATLGLVGFAAPAAQAHFLADNPNDLEPLGLNGSSAPERWAASYGLETFGDRTNVDPRSGATTMHLVVPQPSPDDPVDRSGYVVRIAPAESSGRDLFWYALLPGPPQLDISLESPYFDVKGYTSEDVDNPYEPAVAVGGGAAWFWSGYRPAIADAFTDDGLPTEDLVWDRMLETPWPPPPLAIPGLLSPLLNDQLPSARILVGTAGQRILAGPFLSDGSGVSTNGHGTNGGGSAESIHCNVQGSPIYGAQNVLDIGLPLTPATNTADCTIDGRTVTWTGLVGATAAPTVAAAGTAENPLSSLRTTATSIVVEQQTGIVWSTILSSLAGGIAALPTLDPGRATRVTATLGTVVVTTIVPPAATDQPVELHASATAVALDPSRTRVDLTAIVTPSDSRPLAGGGFAPVRISCSGTTLGYLYGNGFEPPGGTLDPRWVDPGSALSDPSAPAGSQVSARRLIVRTSDCPLAPNGELSLDLAVDQPYLTGTPVHLSLPVSTNAPVATSPATISGTTIVGSTLTAVDGTWMGTPTPSVTRRWLRCNTDGSGCVDLGETAPTHPLIHADAGHTIKLTVQAVNDSGTSTSSANSPAITEAPLLQVAASISGTTAVGSTLTAVDGTWTGTPTPVISHRWLRCNADGTGCVDLGETATTHLVVSDDVGHTIALSVRATNVAGEASADASSAAIPLEPHVLTLPSISGQSIVGSILTANSGVWSGWPTPTLSRTWLRCDSGGTSCVFLGDLGPTYALTELDVGHTLEFRGTAANDSGSTTWATSTSIVIERPPPTASDEPPAPTLQVATAPSLASSPGIAGAAVVGATLRAVDGSWSGTPAPLISRVWQRCDADDTDCGSPLGSDPSYTILPADAGHEIRLSVTATNAASSITATASVSVPVAAAAHAVPRPTTTPTVARGPRTQGSVITVKPGAWRSTTAVRKTYRWYRDGHLLTTAHTARYRISRADQGHRLRCHVTVTNAAGSVGVDVTVAVPARPR
jgi:subtilisin family serine protease